MPRGVVFWVASVDSPYRVFLILVCLITRAFYPGVMLFLLFNIF